MEKKTIGAFIAVLRKATGMTQRELAEKLNVSDKAVSRWERDETLPDLTLIPVLAEMFGVTADELLRGQRITREEPPEERREKAAKRLQYLLDKAAADCRICTVIACLMAALGLVMAPIFISLLDDPWLAFLMACIFLVGGVAVQMVGKVRVELALSVEEFDAEALMRCRRNLLRQTMLGICVNVGVLCINCSFWLCFNIPPFSAILVFVAAWSIGSLLICSHIHHKKGYGDLFTAKTRRKLWTAMLLTLALSFTTAIMLAVRADLRIIGRPAYFQWSIPFWVLLYLGEILLARWFYRKKE